MSYTATALVEYQNGTKKDGSPIYAAFAKLYLNQGEGLALHLLGGYDADSEATPADMSCSGVANEAYQRDLDCIASGVYKLEASDPSIAERKGRVRGGVTPHLEAVLSLLGALGPTSRIVFWYTT